MHDVRTVTTVETTGRFSTGMERLGPSSEKDRIGRFSTGMEQLRFEDSWPSPSRAA